MTRASAAGVRRNVVEFRERHEDGSATLTRRSATSRSRSPDLPGKGEFVAILGPVGLRQVARCCG